MTERFTELSRPERFWGDTIRQGIQRLLRSYDTVHMYSVS